MLSRVTGGARIACALRQSAAPHGQWIHSQLFSRRTFASVTVNDSRETMVVIGGGISGMNIAHQLARRIDPVTQRVVLLEKGKSLGEGSTGASSAICRHVYTHDEMITMAIEGLHAYHNWKEYLGIDSSPMGEFSETGALWEMGPNLQKVEAWRDRLATFNVHTEVLTQEDVLSRFPMISISNMKLDFSGQADCDFDQEEQVHYFLYEPVAGYFEPVSALEDLKTALLHKNRVEVVMNARVTDVAATPNGVSAVTLNNDTIIPCTTVVNASGPWCNEVQKMAGVEIPLTFDPVRIQVAYKECKEYLDPKDPKKVPITFFMNDATYFRPQLQQQQMICSTVREEDELDTMHNPDAMPRICDPDMRQQYINNYQFRFPEAESRGQVNGISGMYTVCREDVHPAIGPTKLKGYYIANGFSGHGFKIGPMTGSLLAQAITGRKLDSFECSLDVNFFDPYRTPHPMKNMGVLA